MKKRYARILAATLSAAMVFTSAPSTVFNTGVIEAQAAATAADAAALQKAVDLAIANVDMTALTQITFNDSTTAQSQAETAVAAIIAKAARLATDSIADGVDTTIAAVGITDGTNTIVNVADSSTAAGSYTAEVKFQSGSYSYEKEIGIKINQKTLEIGTDLSTARVTATAAWLPVPAGNYTYNMSALKKNAAGDAFTSEIPAGYDLADWDSVRALGYGDKVKVDIKKEYAGITPADLANYTIEGVDHATIKDGKLILTYEIEVHKAARTKADALDTLTDVLQDNSNNPLKEVQLDGVDGVRVLYKIGDTEAKLDGTFKDKVEIDAVLVTLDDKTTTKATDAVRVKTKKEYDPKEYGGNGSGEALEDGEHVTAGTTVWTYKKADKKFYATLGLVVGNKTIAQKDIVWPTALASGVALTSGDTLSEVKLAETETSKYGKFTIVKAGDKASAKDTVYDVKFTPNTNVTVDYEGDNNDINVTAANVKNAQLRVTVAKKDIPSADADLSLSTAHSTVNYGTTYAAVDANVAGKDAGKFVYKLKDVKDAAAAIPVGKQTLTYTVTIKDQDEYTVGGGTSVEKSVVVNVTKPTVAATAAASTNPIKVNPAGGADYISAVLSIKQGNTVKFETASNTNISNLLAATAGDVGDLKDGAVSVKYQWYNTAGKIYGADKARLAVDAKKMLTDTYYCEMTLDIPSSLSQAEKDAWEAIIPGGKITTNKEEVTVTNMNITMNVATPQVYSEINTSATLNVTPDTGYTVKSVEWYIEDQDGKKVCDITEGVALSASGVGSAKIPTTLDAATYKVCAKITATGEGKETDVAVKKTTLVVSPKTLKKADFTPTQNTSEKKITYGDPINKVKYSLPKDTDKFGTYEWKTGKNILEVTGGLQPVYLRFIPSATTLKNYEGEGGFDFTTNGYYEFTLAADVAKKELTVKADDITIEVGTGLPSAPTCTVEGLVGDDTVAGLGIETKATIDEAKVDINKVGTYADVVTAEAKFKTANANYETVFKTATGSVIVKAKAVAPSTAPTVAPSKAPAKVATTANAKAVKATVTTKVGASKTTQVKMTAAAKAQIKSVKWTTSNKKVAKLPKSVSKKALKVKVKGLKKGKATIKAVVTFKDGSKKTIKFTVKVK